MYLKALEIQGFKSFPEKTRLTFEKNITAIVGPNGSGKSNISDALRWVMGEQNTRALRGGKMEDVIFGGTELRSQVGFAEVSLILDNVGRPFHFDQDEIMITRRYFRSGESEYSINRETVRLKDVHEILMDTGMGRDGYAIIDQGRIGEILSQRSVDRREILEEAAGISRFRYRKEESERKLRRTDEDLTRVQDKVDELALQVEPLREQAETAKKYLLLRDELRGVEISLWLSQLDKLREDSVRLSADFEQARLAFKQGQGALEEMYQASEDFIEQFRQKDIEAENIRGRMQDTQALIAQGESAAAVLAANVQSGQTTIERIRLELNEQAGREGTLQGQIDERLARMEETQREMELLAGQTEALVKNLAELTSAQGETARDLEEIMGKEGQERVLLAAESERHSALGNAILALEERVGDAQADLAQAQIKQDQQEEKRAACKKELEDAETERQTLLNIIRGHELRLSGREEKLTSLQKEVNDLTLEHGSVENRIAMLKEMEREYQGFTKAVKEVMQEASRGRLGGLHGPVANKLSTKENYALAIETALGASSQNIIVDRPEDGKRAIQFLKRTDSGRATFLPISSIRGNRLVEKGLEQQEGFIGLAIDLVEFEERFASVYKNLLGRTVIVEDLDCAISIAKAYDNRFRLVTLDGQELRAGGSMTGGSVSRTAGFLSRANEIIKLEKRFAQVKLHLGERSQSFASLDQELKGARAELETAKGEIRQVEDSVLTLEGNLKTHDMILETLAKSLGDLDRELNEGKAQQKAHVEERLRLEGSTQSRKEAIETLQGQMQALTQGQSTFGTQRDELSQSLSDMQARRASLAAEREAIGHTVEELSSLAKSIGGDKQQKENEMIRLAQEAETQKAAIVAKEEEIAQYRAQGEQLREALGRIGEEKLQMEARRSAADRSMQERNREILNMERECSRLEQKKITADLEEKQIIDKLWDTYELSHSAACLVRQEIESVAHASREVSRLKASISALGTPNIGAITQFEVIGERYEFLTEQKADIEKAKGELLDIIGDITREMEEIFSKAFAQIDKTFQETFTELFGGGQASLELEDPEDILGSGVEIRVQPPGKSLKTLTLLSGGEKAFVAVALYFSIQKIRPTPFCVMDEIEAALDEANVLRFAQYMRKLSHKTQFITITHRRGTMEEADMLYGVTMQERGVSRVIHVDLEEAEKAVIA